MPAHAVDDDADDLEIAGPKKSGRTLIDRWPLLTWGLKCMQKTLSSRRSPVAEGPVVGVGEVVQLERVVAGDGVPALVGVVARDDGQAVGR